MVRFDSFLRHKLSASAFVIPLAVGQVNDDGSDVGFIENGSIEM